MGNKKRLLFIVLFYSIFILLYTIKRDITEFTRIRHNTIKHVHYTFGVSWSDIVKWLIRSLKFITYDLLELPMSLAQYMTHCTLFYWPY